MVVSVEAVALTVVRVLEACIGEEGLELALGRTLQAELGERPLVDLLRGWTAAHYSLASVWISLPVSPDAARHCDGAVAADDIPRLDLVYHLDLHIQSDSVDHVDRSEGACDPVEPC